MFGIDFIRLNSDKLELILNGKSGLDLKKFAFDIAKKDDKYFLKIGEDNEIILKEIKTIKNMSNMFCPLDCEIISIDFENWNTSSVTNMKKCFFHCNNIRGISNWNTSKVIDMSYTFSECKNIPDISNWDTSNVNYMTGLFFNCIFLSSLPDLSKWNKRFLKNV